MSAEQRILVSIDPTASDHPCLDRGTKLAAAMNATLELFVCDQDPGECEHATTARRDTEAVRRQRLQTHTQCLNELALRASQHGVAATIDVRWDHPLPDGIVRKVIETRPSLVIKDTHYHGPIRRTLFSNTDWELIRQCPAPLLLAKPGQLPDTPCLIAAVDPMHENDKPAELDHRILDEAEALKQALSGELHVFHGLPLGTFGGAGHVPSGEAAPVIDEKVRESATEAHREALNKLLAERPVASGFVDLQIGEPADLLVRLAGELDAGIVVMGAVARGPLRRKLVGSTAERVLDRLPCDLVVVKPAGFASEIEGA